MDPEPNSAAILFADVAGSTRLYETLGDAEALATITRCLELIKAVCVEHGGRVVKTIGDEVMAIFANAANCAYATIDIQRRIHELAAHAGTPLSIHAGFHAGPVIDDGVDVFGDTVNVAARLCSLAKGGQTLTAADTASLFPPALQGRTRSQDLHTVKGKQADIAVVEVIWQESDDELTTMAPRQAGRNARLVLRHAGREIALDAEPGVLTFGRDEQNDVVISDRMASRLHARIERRRDKFVLIDHSTNGTFCAPQEGSEIELRREELLLRGRGRIAFGHTASDDPADTIEFDAGTPN